MRLLICSLLIILVIGNDSPSIILIQAEPAEEESLFLKKIHVPQNLTPDKKNKVILIAVVDDGVRITHRDLKDFIWTNPKEVPDNQIDDDGNGYVDDIPGWDVSDQDNNVAPPEGRTEFYHGTHVAGIVTQIVKFAYGESASDLIKIIPVKSLSDRTKTTYLKNAYKGIEYALDSGADIIICSWGIGRITPEESRILQKAEKKGALIVASAGNLPEERDQYPAAYRSVVAVAALDNQGQKIKNSNFGQFIDLSALGVEIRSASARSDETYEVREGTSFSTPMVAAAAALIKLQHPTYSNREIEACLKSSVDVIEVQAPRYYGKLGAGKLNVESAVRCNLLQEQPSEQNRLINPKGYLYYKGTTKASVSWLLEPEGDFKGIWFRPVFNREEALRGTIDFYTNGSSDARKVASYSLDSLPERIYVPGNSALVHFEPSDSDKKFDWLLEYEAETINFSTLYCEGTKYRNEEGTLTDGSGPNDYSYNTDCKWLITAPEGKVIHFKFKEFDTEPKTDWVYFFHGSGTHEKIMAMFSGPDIPPELTTWGNQVLLWFVTNGVQQNKGWQVEYSFQDP